MVELLILANIYTSHLNHLELTRTNLKNYFEYGCVYSTPSQIQYWTRLITSLISLLIKSYDHVTFTIGSLNPSFGQEYGNRIEI